MSSHQVVLLPGDGIGPEIAAAVQEIIAAAGGEITWLEMSAGSSAVEEYGQVLPDAVLEAIRDNKVALKGPVTTPVGAGFRSVNVSLRQKLGLFANLRPVKSLPGDYGRYPDVDLIIIRENTEGLYIGEEIEEGEDTVIAIKKVTRSASRRVAEFAFDLAVAEGRSKLTVVHKANILKKSDGLFLETAHEIAANYPKIECTDRIIDALAMDLVLDPGRHDLLLCPNLYGDIISDLAAGLIGGLGLAPGANIGDDTAVFEAVHGSAPDIAGKGIANPTALIRASVMMLNHLGQIEGANQIIAGLDHVLKDGSVLTPDLGGTATTRDFTKAVIKAINII